MLRSHKFIDTFCLTERKRKILKVAKKLHGVQWINLHQNNSFVNWRRLSLLCEKSGVILLVLVGLKAGSPAVYIGQACMCYCVCIIVSGTWKYWNWCSPTACSCDFMLYLEMLEVTVMKWTQMSTQVN